MTDGDRSASGEPWFYGEAWLNEGHRPTVEVDGVPLHEGFPVRRVTLEVVDGPDAGRQTTSDQPTIRVGADALCDLVLSDPTVSRHHAELQQRHHAVFLVDLNSTNGTYMAGRRVSQVELETGQIFRVGRTKIAFDVRTEKVSILPTRRTRYDDIIGHSVALRQIFSILDRVSPSDLSVLIEGETGSGKELIARAVHEHSARRDGPFIVFDCSAFAPSLLASELFGHEKGAFTGAVGKHLGVFERAHGGTLFLDELGELDMDVQAKFLRVLETGQLRRVGGERTVEVDVRVVSATNRNVREMVDDRTFRADLFYRLAQVRFLLPPLRERVEDITPLVEHFLDRLAQKTGRRPFVEPEAIQALQRYPWPGNVRELKNTIEKAVALTPGATLTADYFVQELAVEAAHDAIARGDGGEWLPPPLQLDGRTTPAQPASPYTNTPAPAQPEAPTTSTMATLRAALINDEGEPRPFKHLKDELVSQFERQYLDLLLQHTAGNIAAAARTAGVDRRHLYRLIDKHNIEPPREG